MTIAGELQDLSTNLQSAKDAVTNKGGSVGDTGLNGLATEINSIPSGGGGITNYGSITYLDNNNISQTLTLENETDYLELTIGGSGSDITVNGVTMNKSNITSVTIADGVQYIPDNFMYGGAGLTSATIPQSVHFIGQSAFLGCSALNSAVNLSNVIFIGSGFMQSCSSFNQPLNIPKVREIGSNFLQSCTSFNSALTLNPNTEVIGDRFLSGCTAFSQSLTIPSGLISTSAVTNNPGQRFMNGCNNFTGPLVCSSSATSKIPTDNYTLATTSTSAPMYATGVTLTGDYAQNWKTKLADRTSSPYRKLVVGS